VFARLAAAARAAGAWVAIGINERDADKSRTTLYNTLLIFDAQGGLVSRHRKLMPTGGERLVWTPSERADLVVHDTPLARLSGLICWENYMPPARYALYAQGAEVHLAPTWDKSEQWLASLRHIAREGRAWVIGCCQALHLDHVPDRYAFKNAFPAGTQWINVGNSLIVDPDGIVVAGPLAEREGILIAEIDPARAASSRWIFDAAGHYSRADLFDFAVRDAAAPLAAPRRSRAARGAPSGEARKTPRTPAKPTRREAARTARRKAAPRRGGARRR
jgi:nitrilase